MSEPPADERPPISWEALAAELDRDEERAAAPEEAWDAAAARLAAALRPAGDVPATHPDDDPDDDAPVAGRPAVEDLAPVDPAAAEEAATVEEAPHLAAPARLARAPRPAPVELEVVDQPEPAVEELVPVDDGAVEGATAAVDPAGLRGGLEALLFVVDAPVDVATLAAALRCPVAQVRAALAVLAQEYEERRAGVMLRQVGEGWRVYTREEHAAVVERHLLEGQRSRLTQAALETLAVVAYRQPVTRARISAIRGVGVDAVVRTLVNRGLVYECGSDPDTGGGLYATTPLFLERLGLTGLAELPALAPLLPDTASMLDQHPDS
ncbi:MAG TPA: SMC-Scp complex subunit ScpB [Modestobacter sp.]|nr:SMC-Scp complex subunit ScpB [Modestobacter sp.]